MTNPEPGPVRDIPRSRASAFYWALVGALGAFGLVSLLSIGIFVLLGTALLTVLAIALEIDRRTTPALLIGAAVTPFYIAWLNRDGPGNICTAIQNGTTCGEQSNPWPFVAAGAVMIALGVVLLRAARGKARRALLADPPYPPINRR